METIFPPESPPLAGWRQSGPKRRNMMMHSKALGYFSAVAAIVCVGLNCQSVAFAQDVYVTGKSVVAPHPLSSMTFRSQVVRKEAKGCSTELIVFRISNGSVEFFLGNGSDTKIKTGGTSTIETGKDECIIEINIKSK
ncbi:MAG: hypothetical protein LW833_11975 [Hyphomicrobiales bacterium]|nr:hypothetical protein [Hyphomicrobiales bacterium]